MKTDISVMFKVPVKAYEILEMIADQNKRVDLYVMGGNEILISADLWDFPNGAGSNCDGDPDYSEEPDYSENDGWDQINQYFSEDEKWDQFRQYLFEGAGQYE